MNVNWDTYAETFPTRYLNLGPFDEAVDRELRKLDLLHYRRRAAPPAILEIGGGTTGCPSLSSMVPEDCEPENNPLIWTNGTEVVKDPEAVRADARYMVWFLDPFVTKVPDWVIANLTWEEILTKGFYNLVIARGCINYLTDDQIQLIPRLLYGGGVFLANTFENLPVCGSRRVTNRSGLAFTEVTRLEPPDLVLHQLIPDNGGEAIEHSFRHLSRERLLDLLGSQCKLKRYGTNSLLVTLEG